MRFPGTWHLVFPVYPPPPPPLNKEPKQRAGPASRAYCVSLRLALYGARAKLLLCDAAHVSTVGLYMYIVIFLPYYSVISHKVMVKEFGILR